MPATPQTLAIGHPKIMNTIVVVTPDLDLHGRIARALANDSEITRLAWGDPLPRYPAGTAPFIVLDVRGRERTAIADLAGYCCDAGPHARCVAVARVADANRIRIVTALGHEVVAAIFPDVEAVEHVIRTHLSDPSRSAAAAVAHEVVVRLLPRSTHEILRVVFGTAFRVSLVKQLAAKSDVDRTSIAKALRRVSDWTPKGVMNVAKASYSVILLRQTMLSQLAIAKTLGFEKQESLGALLERTFKLPAIRVRDSERSLSAGDWLERELATFLYHRGSSGNRLDTPPATDR